MTEGRRHRVTIGRRAGPERPPRSAAAKFGAEGARGGGLEGRVAKLEARADLTDDRFGRIETKLDRLIDAVHDMRVEMERQNGILRGEIGALRTEMTGKITDLRVEMKEEIGDLRAEMKEEIGDLRAEMKGEMGDLRAEMKGEMGDLRVEMKGEMGDLRAEMKGEMGDLKGEMGELRGAMVTKRDARNYVFTTIGLVTVIVSVIMGAAIFLRQPMSSAPLAPKEIDDPRPADPAVSPTRPEATGPTGAALDERSPPDDGTRARSPTDAAEDRSTDAGAPAPGAPAASQ